MGAEKKQEKTCHWRIGYLNMALSFSTPCLVCLLLLLLQWKVPAFELNLPGGRSISYSSSTGVLRINLSQPKMGKPIPSAPPLDARPSEQTMQSIEVRDTGTDRGYGAFATEPLDEATFLGWYEGTIVKGRKNLDERINARKRQLQLDAAEQQDGQDGANDYVLSLDGGVTFIDGYDRAQDRSCFSPAHLNHEDSDKEGCNCVRVLDKEGKGVAFFTQRLVAEGEELCFDYGRNFWKGREDQKL